MASYYAQIDVNVQEDITRTNNKIVQVHKTINQTITPKVSEPTKTNKAHNIGRSKIVAGVVAATTFGNSIVGSYTGNKYSQGNINTMIGIGALMSTLPTHPVSAAIAATTYTIKRTTDLALEKVKSEEESRFKQSYLGNMTTSGSRWRG